MVFRVGSVGPLLVVSGLSTFGLSGLPPLSFMFSPSVTPSVTAYILPIRPGVAMAPRN